jgi:hypothetical protein
LNPPQGLVFRDAVAERSQAELCDDLAADVATALASPPAERPAALVRALLSTAALEGGLSDAGDPLATAAMEATDRAAGALVRGHADPLRPLADRVQAWRSPRRLRITRPEGFAYYALDPLAFGRAAAAFLGSGAAGQPAVVVGIRTIGVALGAAAAAWLASAGVRVRRLTVRPEAHAYDRVVCLTEADRQLLRGAGEGAAILVVDEGPGLSGSSFLAAGEALRALPVPAERIALFGTRAVQPESLLAPRAAARWSRFRFGHFTAGDGLAPGERDFSGGAWRPALLADPGRFPASWLAIERRKALSPDGQVLRKFEGLGRHGDAVFQRARLLAEEGWSPPPLGPPDGAGFLRYRFVPGRPLRIGDRSAALAAHLGRYLAARARLLPAQATAGEQADFARMVEANLAFTLPGRPPPRPAPWPRVAVVDGRLAPHEWIGSPGATPIKTDSADHGDDHFFPGPTDIAWDLAAAVVEWELDPGEQQALLEAYKSAAGEDARPRLPYFTVAYTAFRARYCQMALAAAAGDERTRWRRRYRAYVRVLRRAAGPGHGQSPAG